MHQNRFLTENMRLIGHILLEHRYVKYFVDRWKFGTKGNLVCHFPYSLNNLIGSITSPFLSKPHHTLEWHYLKELRRRQFEIPRVFFFCRKNSSIDFKKSRAFAILSSPFPSYLSWNPFVLCLRVQFHTNVLEVGIFFHIGPHTITNEAW